MEKKQLDQGGLGIIDLKAHNIALLLKFLHKFYNKENAPWVKLTWETLYSRPIPPHHRKKVGSFWWRYIISLSDHFFMMAACTLNEGSSLYFWRDTSYMDYNGSFHNSSPLL
jgi:hypothetical protein